MIVGINATIPSPAVRELLSYATSMDRVDRAYRSYLQSPEQQLFGFVRNNDVVGCIGIAIASANCVIKHIAVSPEHRGTGIGSEMIRFLGRKYPINTITAETDKDAVEFYRSFGFQITSLGEKYPGIERFLCEFILN